MEEKKKPSDGIAEGGTFEELLTTIGEFGRYQRRLYLVLCLPVMICALHRFSWVFLGGQAEHRCLLPFEHAHNASFEHLSDVLNLTLPWDEGAQTWSRCERLHANFSEDYFRVNEPSNLTVPCEAWVFDTSRYKTSAVFEFSLVCDWAWSRVIADSVLMIGSLFGAVFFGNLSDRLGRRPVYSAVLVIQVSMGILASLAPDYLTFVLARFVLGATISGVFVVGYVIGIEMVGPSRRQYAGVFLQMSFSAGVMLNALFAHLVPDWRTMQLAISLPGLLCVAYWWLIPESPRWLVGQGQVAEASKILQKAARVNKSAISSGALDKWVVSVSETLEMEKSSATVAKPSLLQVLKFPNLRRNALVIFVIWFTNSTSYYALSLNTGGLGGHHLVTFAVSGAVEMPGYLLTMLLLNRVGRRPLQCGLLLVAGVVLVIAAAVPPDLGWLLTTLAMLGKTAVCASCATTNVFTVEVFPTCVRSAGVGGGSTLAGLGAIVAPFIVLSSSYWRQLPFVILGFSALATGFLVLLLPETLNRELPGSLEEGDNFGRAKGKLNKDAPSETVVKV